METSRYESRHAPLHAGFATSEPEFSPTPIWWWSGDRVELPRLCEQLDLLVEQGVYNVVVINLAPSGPSYGALADEPALLTEPWWQLWAGLCEHARERGARLWFYDQIGFSGANLQGRLVAERPDFAGASLARVTTEVDGPAELECPSGAEPVAACAVPLDPAGMPVPLPVRDGRVVWTGTGRHRLLLAFSVRRGFDYTSPAACSVLLDQVHGEFERRLGPYLGKVIVGSFQDELPSLPTWSPRFAEEFAKRCGYRIEPVIGALWNDWGVASARVRVDYQRVRAALAEEAFFEPLHAWHARHGMTVGVDQQSPSRAGEPIGCTRQYADYPRTHRWYSAPGSDHWGDAKLHSSLAHHYGRPRTWIEAFHSTGWGGTLEETFDWLQPWLLAGATLYNPHAVYYSTAGGWWEWAPPSTCWRQPYWRHYRHFADTISRLCWLATRGEHVCDVGVLFPSATVAAATLLDGTLPPAELAHRSYLDVVGRMLWFNAEPGALRTDRRDFDVLDDHTIATASVDEGALRTRGEWYRAVVVPGCQVLETATAGRLVEFAEAGGLLVLFGELPEHGDTADGDPAVARLRELAAAGTVRHVIEAGDLAIALTSLDRSVRTGSPALRRRVGDRNVLVVAAAETGSATAQPMLAGTQWSDEVEDLDMARYNRMLREEGYDFDPARNRSRTVVWLAGTVTDAEQWDPVTGAAAPAPTRSVAGGTEVTLTFDAAPLAVLVWSDVLNESFEAPDVPNESFRALKLDGFWRSTVDSPVAQWRPWHRVDGDWRQVLVGHGEFAQVRGPDPDGDWRPVAYSLSRGIEKDPAHVPALGPKGRVPEEFWHVDDVRAGQSVWLRTTLPVASARELTLAVGTNAALEVWWNGERLPTGSGGYLRLAQVRCLAGHNRLELRVHAEQDGPLRGYWALTEDPDAFVRPEWITPADGPLAGTIVHAGTTVTLPAAPRHAIIQLGTEGAARFLVNGTEIAVQGAFDPYATRPNPRVLPHGVTEHLRAGENRLEVVFRDSGAPVSLVLDALITGADGDQVTILSGADWTWRRDGAVVPTALRRRQSYDPRWVLLRPRPHPLPRASGQPSAGVLDVVPDFDPDRRRADEWFRLDVPPGAVRARLPLVGETTAWLDEDPLSEVDDQEVELPHPERAGRVLLLRVRPTDGRGGGALWDGPAEFDCETGTLPTGPWDDVGLSSYSGGVTYHREVELTGTDERVLLDLGAVRGTAEVEVNGRPAGVRIWSPYRFDLTGLVENGTNRLSVTVFNTLGPLLDDSSPTAGVYAGQRVSGLLGPVRLMT